MAVGKKFKDTDYAVREDFSLQTRIARKKLRDYAKSINAPIKLNIDKLRVDGSYYVYDAVSDTVIKLPR